MSSNSWYSVDDDILRVMHLLYLKLRRKSGMKITSRCLMWGILTSLGVAGYNVPNQGAFLHAMENAFHIVDGVIPRAQPVVVVGRAPTEKLNKYGVVDFKEAKGD
ncbi:hypothetical protein GOBAR_AA29894 [Gossypium barbadense]|uniref:Uncharacterized protein n=1 Tax=Gossypium barbadense TaxID=3634 RepID=A0A2P5WI86_GOSBA|nr:hypothetical protein GOBAR_AA29894 [Gossypium barbadense]